METVQATTAAPTERKKNEIDLVQKVHQILQDKGSPLAPTFLERPYVKQAIGQDEKMQRILINRELRMYLGSKPEDTQVARLALDDDCFPAEYLKNLKRYTVPQL